MSKLKNALIIGGGVVLLGLLGTLTNRGSMTSALHAADSGPVVTIGGPLPLSTTAAQNGAWNVGIAGTPNVTVANTPGVNINNTPNVNIAGTPNVNVPNTVAVRNVDEKGRIPYMQSVSGLCSVPNGLSCIVFPPVPDGMRLVVEHVNGHIEGNFSGLNSTFLLTADGVFYALPGRSMSNPNIVGVNEQVLAYYEAGQQPIYIVTFLGPNDSAGVQCTISGYLINLSQ